MTSHRPLVGVLLGGTVAATLDIVYAILRNGQFGKTPLWVLQSIASGWLGSDAFASGLSGGLMGLVSHYGILLVGAAVYYALSRRHHVFQSQAVACGALFGVLVHLFMNFVVIPVSAFPFELAYTPRRLVEGFASHAVFVGIPIALAVRRFSPPGQ